MKTIVKNLSLTVLVFSCVLFTLTGFTSPMKIIDSPTTHTVTISQMKFNPAHLEVKKGDRVVWINKDIVPHDVTETNKKWTSGPFKMDVKWSKIITEGFDYYCSIHVVMKGSISIAK